MKILDFGTSRILNFVAVGPGQRMSRYLLMLTLVVAGQIIFGLPFHTARFSRPTLLEVFGFTNAQLGDVFAAYGVTAMLAYFPGGILADRYSGERARTGPGIRIPRMAVLYPRNNCPP